MQEDVTVMNRLLAVYSKLRHRNRPLLSSTEKDARRQAVVADEDLVLARAHPAPTVKGVILLRRPLDYAGLPAIEELGTLDAVQQILPETSSLSKLPRPLRALAALAEKCGPVLSCPYAESDDLVGLNGELIGSGS